MRHLGDVVYLDRTKGDEFTYTPEEVVDEENYVGYLVTYENNPAPVTGSVRVHYQLADGTTIREDYQDTVDKPVGTPYNTAENDTEKPQQIVFEGVTYELTSVKGEQEGLVTEGLTEVTYVYTKKKAERGNVVARVFDQKTGKLIKQESILVEQPMGTPYSVTRPDVSSDEYIKAAGIALTVENHDTIVADIHARYDEERAKIRELYSDWPEILSQQLESIDQQETRYTEALLRRIADTYEIIVPIEGEVPIEIVEPVITASPGVYLDGLVFDEGEDGYVYNGQYSFSTSSGYDMTVIFVGLSVGDVTEETGPRTGVIDDETIYVDFYVVGNPVYMFIPNDPRPYDPRP